jgi:hypothetical protein
MGRPLNKKYFGNRNIGTGTYEGTSLGNSANYEDDHIGGEGIASINWSNYGSWLSTAGGSDAPLAGLSLPAPSIPGGVQATWTNYFGVAAVTTGAGKSGLVLNETYEYTAIPGFVVRVTNVSGTDAVFTVVSAGSTTTLLTDLQGVNITKTTGMTGAAQFLVDIRLKIVDTVIGEKGSGYTGAETFTVTTANGAIGTAPAGTIVLTTDTGAAGTSTNQENAIIMRANLGNGASIVDIIKQVSTKRYKVTDGTTTGIVTIGTDSTPETGEAYIVATASGGTYYVTKLTSRKAVLVAKTGDEALDGMSVPWSFTSYSATTVQIENA